MMKYDAVEVHPVVGLDANNEVVLPDDKETAIVAYEQCDEDDEDVHTWSIYLHETAGCLNCIADCPTKPIAEKVAEILRQNMDKLQDL